MNNFKFSSVQRKKNIVPKKKKWLEIFKYIENIITIL